MIRHLVALRFKAPAACAEWEALQDALAALLPRVPGALAFRAFVNVSPEAGVVHGFEQGFWFDFADEAARDAYLAHPDHQAVGARLVQACGLDGIQVIDVLI